jgi:hypothetical protein
MFRNPYISAVGFRSVIALVVWVMANRVAFTALIVINMVGSELELMAWAFCRAAAAWLALSLAELADA